MKYIYNNEWSGKILLLLIYSFIFFCLYKGFGKRKNIKVALCTMGKMENLYVKEFIDYYSKLGIDHIFIYDDNIPETEKISDILNQKEKEIVTIYESKSFHIDNQSTAFTKCYKNNLNKFDWFLMVDMDEFLFN